MKKIIGILLLLVSCSTPDYTGYAIVTHVNITDDSNKCWYRVEVYERGGYTPDSFKEECNKFTIGDTVYLTKKKVK